ncbi:MAG: helix-turn-helix domain-containing protein [Actinomycetota bacterium]|nr:helix-turn-helix domain-containing protein [Actinomycetota bacterium]
MTDNSTLGETLRERREAAGLSRQQVALSAGLSLHVVGRLEREGPKTRRTYQHFVKACKAVGAGELIPLAAHSGTAATVSSIPLQAATPRDQYRSRDDIDVVYRDILYQMGPDRIPLLWEETLVVRPRKASLDFVVDAYTYSGDIGTEAFRPLRGIKSFESPEPRNDEREFYLYLDREVPRNGTHLLQSRVTFEGCKKEARPWFGARPLRRPHCSFDRMILRLQFVNGATPSEVYEGEQYGDNLERCSPGKPLELSRDNYYERELTDGIPEFSYGFVWKW